VGPRAGLDAAAKKKYPSLPFSGNDGDDDDDDDNNNNNNNNKPRH
jgi:hypothetical protein